MKGRVLPVSGTDTQILTISINPTEANILLDQIQDASDAGPEPVVLQLLIGYLSVVADQRASSRDMVNTDGRHGNKGANDAPARITQLF